MNTPPLKFKIALIGSHGVGKTTLCFGLAARLKSRDVSLDVVHEVARRCPLPINEDTSLEAQSWILHTQLAEELVASARYPVVLCDRSVVDNYVYLQLGHGSVEHLSRLVADWLPTYDQLYFVPVTEVPQDDGTRAIDPSFQKAVDTRLKRELEDRGVDYFDLAEHTRGDWLDVVERQVLAALEPPQLKLI